MLYDVAHAVIAVLANWKKHKGKVKLKIKYSEKDLAKLKEKEEAIWKKMTAEGKSEKEIEKSVSYEQDRRAEEEAAEGATKDPGRSGR